MSAAARELTVIVARGAWGTVEFVVRDSGDVPAQAFLQKECREIREGGKAELQSTAETRFMVLFDHMANVGKVQGKRFGSEMDGFSAFKHEVKKLQIRFPCFRDENRWILTHGFTKKGKKGLGAWPESEVERAQQIRREYFTAKKARQDSEKENAGDE